MTVPSDRLRRIDGVRDLEPVLVDALAGVMEVVTVADGASLITEGEAADALYLLDAGTLEVFRAREGLVLGQIRLLPLVVVRAMLEPADHKLAQRTTAVLVHLKDVWMLPYPWAS